MSQTMPSKKKGSHKKTPPPKKGSTSETTQPDYPKEKNTEKEHENVCDLSQEEQIDEKVAYNGSLQVIHLYGISNQNFISLERFGVSTYKQCKHKGMMLNSVSVTIDAAIRVVSSATDWQTRIPANTPFEKLIKHPNANVYYNWPIDLLHFVGDFLGHISDNDQFGKKMYIDEAVKGNYSNEQYVKKMIGDIFLLFLVEFYKRLSETLYGDRISYWFS
ncbi:hypothetical protein LOK49_LG10G01792 [Camellia lanceoleosa]|uniref:Uncharacterized protein n=1 Tax=Camellia lanceoleosa TaxID=1840588 RepID=A0ACC0G9N5_9ERIC|nr:hypothetical protein LOK49_LG10G01792 [Camellia lanceoleosa]